MPTLAGCIQNASQPPSSALDRNAAIFQLFADVLLDFLAYLAAPRAAIWSRSSCFR